MADWPRLAPEVRADFESLEDEFFAEAPSIRTAPKPNQRAFMQECWRRAEERAEGWRRRLESRPVAFANRAYAETWRGFNAAAAFPMA